MYALDTASSWKPLEQHSVCRHLSCQHVWWASANFFCLFPHVPPIYHYWGWTFFQLNGRQQNFYCWGVHQCSCSLLSWHHNVLVLTNLTTGQTIILRHRQNLWMGKSFRDTQSTFHLWELLVHVLLGSQMDAGGTAFKSRGSGKNTSFSITARLMPVFLVLKWILLLCWDKWVYFWHCGSPGRPPAIIFLSCGSVTPGEGDGTEASSSSCCFCPFLYILALALGKHIMRNSALYTGLCPSHHSIQGKDACKSPPFKTSCRR